VTNILASFPPSKRLPAGRHGGPVPVPGVTVREIVRAAAILVAGRGQATTVIQIAKTDFGVEISNRPSCAAFGPFEFIGIGPGRWLVLTDGGGDTLTTRLESAFAPHASVTCQSGGLIVFEASGAAIADVLPKFIPVDLHPSAFPAGSAAAMAAAHVNLTLWLTAAGFWRFAAGRSYACAFLRVLASASAEYGLELGPEPAVSEALTGETGGP
jgi:heterotetrameric sarcosine oxidase gamma subunit